jgi:hypothetical protein
VPVAQVTGRPGPLRFLRGGFLLASAASDNMIACRAAHARD